MLKREDGVLDGVRRKDGVEMRYHVSKRHGEPIIRRVAWHRNFTTKEWYPGIEGPEMSLQSLQFVINEYVCGKG
jgi:hypothetical protein